MSIKLIYKDVAPGAKEDISEIQTSDLNTTIADTRLLEEDMCPQINYATLEHRHWALDGTFKGIPDNNVIPYWSTQVSSDTDEDGRYHFSTPISITRVFNSKHTSVGISFVFDNEDFCNYLNIKWYNDDELVAEDDFEPNSVSFYCKKNVEIFNKTVITFYSMNRGNRFLKVYGIDDGVNREFDESDLYSVSILEEMSLISEELPINTLEVSLKRTDNTEFILQNKQPLLIYHNNELYGTFFIDGGDRTSRDVYDISAQDYKGVLDTTMFYGGIYFNEPAGHIIDDIFADEKFSYTIDEETANTPLTGYIRICTKREALAQVLFACCSVCDTSRSNKVNIFKLSNELTEILPDKIFMGGKTTSTDIVTSVIIAIHKYTVATEATQVYSGDVVEGENFIEFSSPIDITKTVSISGATMVTCDTNYCIVSATSAGTVTITAYEYTDNITNKIMTNTDVLMSTATNQIEITDATLISNSNADKVLLNVFNHYIKNTTLETDIVIENNKCGDNVNLHTDWSGKKQGHIEKLEYDIRNKTIGKVVQRIG